MGYTVRGPPRVYLTACGSHHPSHTINVPFKSVAGLGTNVLYTPLPISTEKVVSETVGFWIDYRLKLGL